MTGWLLGTLFATSALILLVLLVREPVRKRFGSRVAYGLWLIPAARLLMPTLTQTVERAVPSAVPVQPLVQPVIGEPMMLAQVAPAGPSLIEQAGGWPTILMTLWLGVAAGLFLTRTFAFHRDRRAILAKAEVLARIGSVRLVRSSEVCSPIAFGILDKVIAVPVDFDRLYDERERRLALDHELAHHRSGDLVANLFAFVLLCLQWFNPLAWVAHAAFRFDQEAACDARVLDKAKVRDRADYGRAIAKAASGRALLFASALDRRNTLHRRLKSMLNNPTTGNRTAGKLMIMTAVAIALPLTATRAIEYVDVPEAPAAPGAGRAGCADGAGCAHGPGDAGRTGGSRSPGASGPARVSGRADCPDTACRAGGPDTACRAGCPDAARAPGAASAPWQHEHPWRHGDDQRADEALEPADGGREAACARRDRPGQAGTGADADRPG